MLTEAECVYRVGKFISGKLYREGYERRQERRPANPPSGTRRGNTPAHPRVAGRKADAAKHTAAAKGRAAGW